MASFPKEITTKVRLTIDPSYPTMTGGHFVVGSSFGTAVPFALCPDLLRHEQLGTADNFRGRVVRGFFWFMRLWPVR